MACILVLQSQEGRRDILLQIFFFLALGLWLSDRNWHHSARQVSTHTVVQVSQHLPNPQE